MEHETDRPARSESGPVRGKHRDEQEYEDIALVSADWTWEIDRELRFTSVSERIHDVLGFEAWELLGKQLSDIMETSEQDESGHLIKRLSEGRTILGHEQAYRAKDGRTGRAITSAVPKYGTGSVFEGFIGFVRDIDRERASDRRLRLYEKVFESALEGLVITDTGSAIVSINPAFTAITGYGKQEALGRDPSFLVSDYHDQSFFESIVATLIRDGRWSGEVWNRRKNGESFPVWLTLSSIVDETGRTINYLGMFHDITENKKKEQQIRFQALHDPLTGLPNRVLFNDRLTMAIRHSARRGMKTALLFFDLDNFKNVNDTLGHTAGDMVLKEAAERVTSVIRSEDTLARLGGDEFVILLEEAENDAFAVSVAERIIESFSEAFHVLGYEFFLTASIGIAISPDDGESVDTLIKHADMAMYRAKDQGKNCYYTYTPSIDRMVSRRVSLESRMRKALEREEYYPMYQPRVNGDLSAVTGVEALVRWNDPDGNIIQPDMFIPVAEENGLVVQLDLLVLRKACMQMQPLIDAGRKDLRVSANLSSKHFGRKELVPAVEEILRSTGFRPGNLELEITETALMTEIDTAVEKITQLASLGICITIDDFGTGYSSLYYLKKLPINMLKIDRSFTRDINTDQDDAEIVATVIAMAKTLNMKVVAEGVETIGQLEFLRNHGCDEYQGYLFSRPLPFPELTRFLTRSSPLSTFGA